MDQKIKIPKSLIWLCLKHFKRSEAWGDPDLMDPFLLLIMDGFRDSLPKGCWIKVHNGYKEGGHSQNSYHYKGMASDWHVEGCSLVNAERWLMRYLYKSINIDNSGKLYQLIDYVGIGIYPDWNNPGFHLDVRGKRASWARLNNQYVAYRLGVEAAKERRL